PPTLGLAWPIPAEREATLTGTPPAWSGPDVRAPSAIGAPPWPAHHGKIGACADPQVYAALARLGSELPRSPQATQSRRTPSISSPRSQGLAKTRSALSTLPDA